MGKFKIITRLLVTIRYYYVVVATLDGGGK
jgi:hypothetical protein